MVPPPPATPNPRHFAPSKHPKPQATFRSSQHQTPQSASSRQFASAPRFSFGSTQRTQQSSSIAEAGHPSSPLIPRQAPRFPGPIPARKKDEIEDTESDNEHEDANLQSASHSHPQHKEIIDDPPSPSHNPLPHKRRRLDTITISSSPSPSPPHTFSSPPQRASSPNAGPSSPPHPPTHIQPFILSPKRPPSTSTSATASRPPLVFPPRSPSPPTAMLHPVFSPHRRGGPKFLPGGLAATVRDWVVDLAASTPATKEGQWDMRLRVGEVRCGERVTLVVEEEEENGEDRERSRKSWMLVGGSGEVRKGMVVGIRRPVWDVDVQGPVWRVGVDWGILDG
ncbi:MAG: hypothetical protein Q9166_006002 [cf. Caloplaca sp. 2 TL-2023]